jgi:hypothetical protein
VGICAETNECLDSRIGDQRAHLLVERLGVLAQLEHLTENGDALAVATDRSEGSDARTHRIQVRVVRVIDQRQVRPVDAQLMDVHAVRAQRTSVREDSSHGLQAHPKGERTGGCGQRVRNVVATHDLQLDGGFPFGGHQREGCSVGTVEAHVARNDVGTLVARGREADHASGCQRRHGLDVRVVRVEDDRTARAGSLDEFSLRSRNALETAEATHVGMAHAQLDGHVGGDNVRQVGDVAGP